MLDRKGIELKGVAKCFGCFVPRVAFQTALNSLL